MIGILIQRNAFLQERKTLRTKDILKEAIVYFNDPRSLPGHITRHQLNNWVRHGLHGIKLDWYKIGGKPVTSLEAFDRFMDETNKPIHAKKKR